MGVPRARVRERILDAAVALLREHGLKMLAQPQVARAAGVQQGHLTYYFPRREHLVAAVGERFIEMMSAEVHALVSSPEWHAANASVRSRLRALVFQLVRDRARTRMLLALIIESEDDPALRESVRVNGRRVRALLAFVLGREESDPEVQLTLALLWGLGLQQLVLADTRTDEETVALIEHSMTWIDSRIQPAPESEPVPQLEPKTVRGARAKRSAAGTKRPRRRT